MYLRHWNINRKPFSTAFEPEMIVFSEGFAGIFRTLSLTIRIQPSAQWLRGPAGCGKSTLLQSLRSGLAGEAGFRIIPGRFASDEHRFLSALSAGSPEAGWGDLDDSLEKLFLAGETVGRPIVIAVDDADDIADDAGLRLCLRLLEACAENILPLTVILSGKETPALLEPTPSLPAQRLQMTAPTEQEALNIIRHRLTVAGARKRIFSAQALQRAVAEADGDLARLMAICDLGLQIGFENRARTIDESLMRDHLLPFFRRFTASESQRIRAAAAAESRSVIELPENPLQLRLVRRPPVIEPEEEPVREFGRVAGPQAPAEEAEMEPHREEEPPPSDRAETEKLAEEDKAEPGENHAEPAIPQDLEKAPTAETSPETTEEAPSTEAGSPEQLNPFFHTGLSTYRKEYLGRTPATPVDREKTDLPAQNEPVTDGELYRFAVWLIKDVLARLRRLEKIDIGPVEELSETIIRRLASDNTMLSLALEEASDYNLETHLVNVATLSLATGRQLGMPQEDLHTLGTTALLHDIGHLHCGEELLHSENRFDRLDFKKIKQHPQVGHDLILRQTNGSKLIADIILQEHERDDGLGYPNYLSSDQIHPFAKIIGLCDFFEALTHSRAHRRPLKPAEALAAIRETRTRLSERRLAAALSNAVLDALSKART
jgi:type II secretory pathway predicted ATPase ExeA